LTNAVAVAEAGRSGDIRHLGEFPTCRKQPESLSPSWRRAH
jgi:hypothetical protein